MFSNTPQTAHPPSACTSAVPYSLVCHRGLQPPLLIPTCLSQESKVESLCFSLLCLLSCSPLCLKFPDFIHTLHLVSFYSKTQLSVSYPRRLSLLTSVSCALLGLRQYLLNTEFLQCPPCTLMCSSENVHSVFLSYLHKAMVVLFIFISPGSREIFVTQDTFHKGLLEE